jgi:hypothetical protein
MDQFGRRRLLLAGLLLGTSLLSGCSPAPAGAVGASDPCTFGAAAFEVGPVVFCQQAVATAEAGLGWLHWPVTSVQFQDRLCPPNQFGCGDLPEAGRGWVVFTFSIGEPSMIEVTTAPDGSLRAASPEPVPGWLRDALRQQVERPAQPDSGDGG